MVVSSQAVLPVTDLRNRVRPMWEAMGPERRLRAWYLVKALPKEEEPGHRRQKEREHEGFSWFSLKWPLVQQDWSLKESQLLPGATLSHPHMLRGGYRLRAALVPPLRFYS